MADDRSTEGDGVGFLPYAKPNVSDADREAVLDVLQTDWLTTGPKVEEFESAFATYAKAEHAIAVANGTAALHTAYAAAGIDTGDEVIVPTMTFAATANAALFLGARPVFADSKEDTLLIDPASIEQKITEKTKAIVAVDYAGQPCDYDALRSIADKHNLTLIADACHALGATYKDQPVGSLADFSTFSFHAVKPLTTGEGGMVTTNNAKAAEHMRQFRNHGIDSDHKQREDRGSWYYEMQHLGYNYRITDIQCALGMSQLQRVPDWTKRRQELATQYDDAFSGVDGMTPLSHSSDRTHAYHLYVVLLEEVDRDAVFSVLREQGIGVNVHYIPVHLHPYYKKHLGTKEGMCPIAERAYAKMLSLPMFPSMTDSDIERVSDAIKKAIS